MRQDTGSSEQPPEMEGGRVCYTLEMGSDGGTEGSRDGEWWGDRWAEWSGLG